MLTLRKLKLFQCEFIKFVRTTLKADCLFVCVSFAPFTRFLYARANSGKPTKESKCRISSSFSIRLLVCLCKCANVRVMLCVCVLG